MLITRHICGCRAAQVAMQYMGSSPSAEEAVAYQQLQTRMAEERYAAVIPLSLIEAFFVKVRLRNH